MNACIAQMHSLNEILFSMKVPSAFRHFFFFFKWKSNNNFWGVASDNLSLNYYFMKFYSWNKYVVFYLKLYTRYSFCKKKKISVVHTLNIYPRHLESKILPALHLFVIYCCYYCCCIRLSYTSCLDNELWHLLLYLKENYWILLTRYFPLWSQFFRGVQNFKSVKRKGDASMFI